MILFVVRQDSVRLEAMQLFDTETFVAIECGYVSFLYVLLRALLLDYRIIIL